MKLYNISGNLKNEGWGNEFVGLFLIKENGELEELYYFDDEDIEDKTISRDLSIMKDLGKVIFDVMKNHDVEDVVVIDNVKIDAEYYEAEFRNSIIKIIKEQK